MKVRCINNGLCVYSDRLTKGKIYEVIKIKEEDGMYLIKNDDGAMRHYVSNRFEEVKEMEIENVIELEYQEVFDKVAVRIAYQNEDVLLRGDFIDRSIGVRSSYSPEFNSLMLHIRGIDKKDDNWSELVSKEKAEEIKEKVRKINEKYGIRKRWRANYGEEYYCIGGDFKIMKDEELEHDLDNHRHKIGNYFKTDSEAKEVLEKIKQVFKEA